MTFNDWMQQVDNEVEAEAGCSVHDLPDCAFYDMFADEITPQEAATEALREAGWTA